MPEGQDSLSSQMKPLQMNQCVTGKPHYWIFGFLPENRSTPNRLLLDIPEIFNDLSSEELQGNLC
jgi:hypothetical protein